MPVTWPKHARTLLVTRVWPRLGVFSVLSLIALLPALRHAASLNEFRDAQYLFLYEDVAVESVLRYGELPWHNPYYCGGLYALGAPQARFLSPTFVLSLVFGASRAQVVIAFCMTVLGMEGAFRWLRQQTGGALGPVLLAPIIGLNGLFATAFFNGWVHFYGFALVPWVLWGVHRAARGDPRGWVATAVGGAWMLGFGGTYAPLLTSLYAGFELARTLISTHARGRLRLVQRASWLATAAAFCVSISAVRLWPLLETMRQAGRIMAGSPGNTWSTLWAATLARAEPDLGDAGISGAYYFGPWLGALVLFGCWRKRGRFPLAMLVLSIWAATGYAYGSSPFVWLRQLPVFDMIRYPERFLFFGSLYAAVLACLGVDGAIRVMRRRRGRLVIFLATLSLIGASDAGSLQNYQEFLNTMWWAPAPERVEQPFAQARGNRWLASHLRALNRGTLSCQEAYPIAQSPRLRGDLKQEEYLADGTAGTVERKSWSPSRIVLDVRLSQPARLLVNQNHHPGWRADVGRVVSEQGLLAVDLPRGHRSVTLRFVPRSGVAGLTASVAGLAGLLALIWLAPRKRQLGKRTPAIWTAACTLGPFALGAVAALVVPEPPLAPSPLLNANRMPILVSALPQRTLPLGVDFAVPVRLEGAKLPERVSPSGVASFELYWRVTGDVPRSVGIFVHLEGPGQTLVQADHEVVGASVFFKDAPRGWLLRDAFSVNLADAPRGRWRAWAGLWYASGNGQRVRVSGIENVEHSSNGVPIGSFVVNR